MKPYYQDDAVTIYHGDCRSLVVDADALITDPPYGVGYVLPAGIVGHGNRQRMRGGKPPVAGDDRPFDPSPFLDYPVVVLWGANHYADRLPARGGWIVWDKTGGGRGPDDSFADVEMAWTNVGKTPSIFHHLWKGLVRDSEAGEVVKHPTQKPVALMRWVLERTTKPDDVVFDPFMGSGPLARACKDMGRRYVGCELVEAYCAAAVDRLGQEVLPLEAA